MAKSICLDTNVFIRAFEGDAETSASIQPLILALENHRGLAVTSELTLAEVLVKVEKDKDTRPRRIYLDLLIYRRMIKLVPVSRDILIESARCRAVAHPHKPGPEEDKRNFLPDAIHVVSAIRAGCRHFVASDHRIRLPEGMTRIEPDRDGIQTLLGEFE